MSGACVVNSWGLTDAAFLGAAVLSLLVLAVVGVGIRVRRWWRDRRPDG